ncbi:uncharacterized protein CLUP02_07999 [Colletotrichum lupini]|uniref:Uncharacterized protein n=1 Tax=Colletotrichum lupini TaxID=145971 RepID=A0A9Q8STH3_9PEZI|nr:uncharacterized protein CLUP02_07999 [Colletotrichum lupini]UQC82511.1 hypothetical protein CLUP02_07999 [Colletotrichum lupini]
MGFLDSHTPVKPPGQRQLIPTADGSCSRLKLLESCRDDQVDLVGGQEQHETMLADLSFNPLLLGVASDELIRSLSVDPWSRNHETACAGTDGNHNTTTVFTMPPDVLVRLSGGIEARWTSLEPWNEQDRRWGPTVVTGSQGSLTTILGPEGV